MNLASAYLNVAWTYGLVSTVMLCLSLGLATYHLADPPQPPTVRLRHPAHRRVRPDGPTPAACDRRRASGESREGQAVRRSPRGKGRK